MLHQNTIQNDPKWLSCPQWFIGIYPFPAFPSGALPGIVWIDRSCVVRMCSWCGSGKLWMRSRPGGWIVRSWGMWRRSCIGWVLNGRPASHGVLRSHLWINGPYRMWWMRCMWRVWRMRCVWRRIARVSIRHWSRIRSGRLWLRAVARCFRWRRVAIGGWGGSGCQAAWWWIVHSCICRLHRLHWLHWVHGLSLHWLLRHIPGIDWHILNDKGSFIAQNRFVNHLSSASPTPQGTSIWKRALDHLTFTKHRQMDVRWR